MRIAIATEQKYLENGWKEDNVLRIKLVSLLRKDGMTLPESRVIIIDWRDKEINFHTFDAIFISSTWNAVDYPEEFQDWLMNSESDGITRIINCREMIIKSLDKKNYIQELISVLAGKNLVGRMIPTFFSSSIHENKTNQNITINEVRNFFKKTGCSYKEIVIKPRISADGKDMTRIKLVDKSDEDIEKELIEALNKNKVSKSGALIQPFIDTVEVGNDYGEYQLLFINGDFTNATIKPAGFGSLKKIYIMKQNLPNGMIEFAEFIANYFFKKYNIIRVRVDMLVDNEHRPLLLETEFIEPNCNTDSLYKFSLEKLGKNFNYLPCDECPEYNNFMEKFALAIYNDAKRLKNLKI